MDNKLNEIRRKIKFLRADMLRAEGHIRYQVNRGEDCSEAAVNVMAMRGTLVGLIGERNRLGGEERLLNVDERLKLDVREASRKPSSGAPMRFPARSGLAPEWGPVRGKKARHIKNPEPRSHAIGTKTARGRRER